MGKYKNLITGKIGFNKPSVRLFTSVLGLIISVVSVLYTLFVNGIEHYTYRFHLDTPIMCLALTPVGLGISYFACATENYIVEFLDDSCSIKSHLWYKKYRYNYKSIEKVNFTGLLSDPTVVGLEFEVFNKVDGKIICNEYRLRNFEIKDLNIIYIKLEQFGVKFNRHPSTF